VIDRRPITTFSLVIQIYRNKLFITFLIYKVANRSFYSPPKIVPGNHKYTNLHIHSRLISYSINQPAPDFYFWNLLTPYPTLPSFLTIIPFCPGSQNVLFYLPCTCFWEFVYDLYFSRNHKFTDCALVFSP
jgi:hypothetical protein